MDESSDEAPGYDPEKAMLYEIRLADAWSKDVDYYRDLASGVDGPVLELGCGTGRIQLELLAEGVDVEGLDASPAVLSILREQAAERGLDPSVWQGDMTDFETEREYDLVVCPFNTVQHMQTVDDQLAMLQSVYDALAPGGQFVFDTFVPSFDVICERYGSWIEAEVGYDGESYTHRTRTRIHDEVDQVIYVENELCQEEAVVYESEHYLSILPFQQVETLARLSPFSEWTVSGDFTDEPLADGHTTQVWSLRK